MAQASKMKLTLTAPAQPQPSAEQGWISVNDRLPVQSSPEKRNFVIAWFNWKDGGKHWRSSHQFAERSNGHWRPIGGNGNFDEFVTHWMPLPEPPKDAP
jgi:hypothetical protein